MRRPAISANNIAAGLGCSPQSYNDLLKDAKSLAAFALRADPLAGANRPGLIKRLLGPSSADKYIATALGTFANDPAKGDFQKGYRKALEDVRDRA